MKRAALALLVLVAAALPSTARADDVAAVSGSLTMTSDLGDPVGQGNSYSLVMPDASFMTHGDATYYDGNMVRVRAYAAGEWWSLEFQAPTGQTLTAGVTYANAIRGVQSSPPPGPLPRMDVFGDGRGCNTVDGSFTVLGATYGPYGYLQSFHVTFEQHCDGLVPALHGELDVVAPPAPTAQSIQLTIDPAGVAARPSGDAVVHGTIACALPVTTTVDVTVTQQTKKGPLSAAASVEARCDGPSGSPWSATVPSGSKTPFGPGSADVLAASGAFEDYYSQYLGQNPITVRTSQTATVELRLPH